LSETRECGKERGINSYAEPVESYAELVEAYAELVEACLVMRKKGRG